MAWPGALESFPEMERQLMRLTDEDAAVAWCVDRFGADGSGFMAAADLPFPEPDLRLYSDEQLVPFLTAARAEAFRQGVRGYAQDVIVQARPWPFDPGSIVAPVQVVHGELDTLLPLAHSRHTAELIRAAALHVLAGHGHFTILNELPAMVRRMTDRRGRGRQAVGVRRDQSGT
jgi:pimeloyl-ACP methyl ester carboxylesterase